MRSLGVLITILLHSDGGINIFFLISDSFSFVTGLGDNHPVLKGISSGSALSAMKSISVSCSTVNTSLVHSFEWFVNGRKRWEDSNPTIGSDEVTSKWIFEPEDGDVVIECKVRGNQDQSTFVFFSVNKERHIEANLLTNQATGVKQNFIYIAFLVLKTFCDNLGIN